MGGLSRRQFIKAAGALGAASALPASWLADVVLPGALADPAGTGSTLAQTIRLASSVGYSKLTYGPGEPFLLREDLGTAALETRTGTRRALVYLGHHSDNHVLDAQSPARLEPGDIFHRLGAGSAFRPQETLTVQVLDQMIAATNQVVHSAVTGIPMAFTIVTGDLTDSNTQAETRWLVDTYDGKVVTPNTGGPAYEGVQVWGNTRWAYHPAGPPDGDVYRAKGFPEHAGLLDAAISSVDSTGLAMPWYVVFGNHDLIWQGTLPETFVVDILATGNRKAYELGPLLQLFLMLGVSNHDLVRRIWRDTYRPGSRVVTADPEARRMLSSTEWMQAMFDTDPAPGPLGHGFDDWNLSTSKTYWARTEGPCRLLGMDSCNHHNGSEGSITEPQYDWLEAELVANSTRYYDEAGNEVQNPGGTDRLVVVFSHHNSWTMTNTFFDPNDPYPRRMGNHVVALLRRFPNLIAWVNGHSHENRILAHRNPFEAGAGFWEINSASCIDYGQHQRTIDIVDNRDGTISLFTVIVDHAADADPGTGLYTPARLASISRELSANDPFASTGLAGNIRPDAALGKPEDRNCELLLRAPFDLSAYTDAQAELDQMAWETRLVPR